MPSPLITIEQARERVTAAAGRLGAETVQVVDALGRALASDIGALEDVPAFPCSAMDGYAITAGPAGRALIVIAESRAGSPSPRPVAAGTAIRISTGAALPDGATAVIRQEDVKDRGSTVVTESAVGPGENVRKAGEVMRAGARLMKAGTVLGSAELGVAVSAGLGELSVARRPRLTIVCTGDELRAPGEPLAPGQIHNSNGPMLAALASTCGASVHPVVWLPDDRPATEAGLEAALGRSDIVIVSGGVSVGPHDHIKPALSNLGVKEHFWGVALQPGKPTWFGDRGATLVFGLPGNPVSSAVTFTLFAALAIRALQGCDERPVRHEAHLGQAVRRNPAREQALRVRLESRDGMAVALPNGPQGSHVVTSLLGAHALALIPAGEGELAAGTKVTLEPLLR